ncbi:MAG: T9SS type A sorting domain-containing protein [Flavobacteriales bacterium]|nr:T9SS type A sorting domain-containing protein [Flavobacteriales bacterium]
MVLFNMFFKRVLIIFLALFSFFTNNLSAQCFFTLTGDTTANKSCKYALENVVWSNLNGTVAAQNDIIKIGGSNNWDADATSVNQVYNNGFMQTIVVETNTNRMIGLNSVNSNASYTDLEYAFYLVNNGSLLVYENGSNMGNWGYYESGDTLQIAVMDNIVFYLQNGNIIYTSSITPTFPMFVDMSINTVNGTLQDVVIGNGTETLFTVYEANPGASPTYQWKLNGGNVGTGATTYSNNLSDGDVLECVLTPSLGGCSGSSVVSNTLNIKTLPINYDAQSYITNDSVMDGSCLYLKEDVSWQSISGVYENGINNVIKSSGSNSWNSGGFSFNEIKNGGYVETIVNETNTNRMIGLNASNTSVNYNEIDYAFYLVNNASLVIYENGSNMGNWGSYSTGDTLRVSVVNNEVRYIQNGNIVYTSTVAPTLPLYVDMSLNTVGATLESIVIANPAYGKFRAEVNGLANVNYQWKLNGVNVGSNSPSYTNTSLSTNDSIVCEFYISGTQDCGTDTIFSSNVIVVEDNTPTKNVIFAVRNDSIITPSCKYAYEEVSWQSISGLTLNGSNNVTKSTGTNNWNVGGFSYNKVENGGFMQTIVNETNTNRMIGLNATNTSVNYNEIDYAFYLVNNGSLVIYENGSNMGNWGSYSTGDTLRVAVVNNEVKYFQNGNVVYTSTIAPTLPLYVDMSLNTVGATLENITVYNGLYGRFTAFVNGVSNISYQWKLNGANVGTDSDTYTNTSLNDGDEITCNLSIIGTSGCGADTIVTSNKITIEEESFEDFVSFYITRETTERNGCQFAVEDVVWEAVSGVDKNANNITKSSGSNAWNAGAFSYNSIGSNGYMQFIVSETNKNRMIGLNSSNVSFNYNDIDYAFYLVSGGNLLVYENGSNRGSIGSYTTNDTLRINVSGNTVEYLKNGTLLYTSSIVATPPLYVDASLNTVGGTITNVQIANATHGNFIAVGSNLGANPSYQWKLNGINVGANSNSYSNDTLQQNDIITCVVTADYQNCSSTDINSNAITITDMPPLNFTPNFIPTSTTWLGGSTAWYDPSNWSNGVPRSGYNAIIPNGAGNYPTIPNNAYVYAIDVANGASLTLNSNAHLSIYDEWSNAGAFTTNTALVEFKTCVDTSRWNSTTPITIYDMKINNEKGLIINNGIMSISDSLIFADGIIYNDVNEIIFEDNTYWKWASDTSYIEGEVQKTGDDSFTFPVGDNNYYRPASITAPSVVSDHFTTRYYNVDPNPTYDETQKDNSIHHVSNCEYWIIDRTNGASSPRVTLSWDVNSCGVTNLSEIIVARWNGTKWKDHGNGGTTGNTTTGTVITSTPVSSFSPFTLASTTNANPLPIVLTSFIAKENYKTNSVDLTWVTQTEINNDFFTVERSTDGYNWEEVKRLKGAGNSNSSITYNEVDEVPLSGISYYRLKQTDFNGEFSYSDIESVSFDSENNIIIYPNPVKDLLVIKNICEDCFINIYNSNGQLIYTGTNSSINTSLWNNGLYNVVVINEKGIKYSERIIK